MAVRIRLRQQGRRNRPTYRLVVTEATSRRDGKYIENLGWYDPHATTEAQQLVVKADRVLHWVAHGAQVAEGAEHLVNRAAPEVMKLLRDRLLRKREKARVRRKAKA